MENKITNYKNIKKLGLAIIAFEGCEHLFNIISELRLSVDYVSIGLQKVSYHGDKISPIDLAEIYRLKDEDKLVDNILDIELDISKEPRVQETDKRNILILDALDHGCSHCIVIDSDEYYTKKSFEDACKKIDENDYEITYCQYINYYHDYNHFLVYPFKDGMHVPFVTKVKYRHSFDCTDFPKPSDPTRRFVRPYNGERIITTPDGKQHKVKKYTVDYHIFEWNEVKMHHLSWLRADIRKKLNMWSSKKCFEHYDDLIDQAVSCFNRFDENSKIGKAKMLFNTPNHSVDVKAFPKQYIHPKTDFNTRLRVIKEKKKILVLSMSANYPLFNELEKCSNETWRNIDKTKYDNIDFWTFTDAEPGKDTYVDENNHIIYIKKDYNANGFYHTFSKTIFAFRELDKLNIQYDYLLRTNNSTWINIPLLDEFLSYQYDDSQIYCGRIYSSFWSAFNIYAGGEFMLLSKRNVNIIKNAIKDPIQFEKTHQGCDDNLIFGLWNKRLLELKLYQTDYLHSLEDEMLINKDIDKDIDFTLIAYQIKTYNVSDNDRIIYDIQKMKKVLELYNKCKMNTEDLYKIMMEKYYDKLIHIIPYTKQEWFNIPDQELHLVKFKFKKERKDAVKYCSKKQQQCGYYITLI